MNIEGLKIEIERLQQLYLSGKLSRSGIASLVEYLIDERSYKAKQLQKQVKQLQKQVSYLSKQQADNKSGIVDLS